MDTQELLDVAYSYYPKGVDCFDWDKYMASPEIKRLSNLIQQASQQWESDDFQNKCELFKAIDPLMHFIDATYFSGNDRAYNFQLTIIEGFTQYSLCLNVSVVIPYYTTYVLETPINMVNFRRLKHPAKNTAQEIAYKTHLDKMAQFAEEVFLVKRFPDDELQTIILDLSIETIRPGEFTMFNAFFLDDYYTLS